MASIKLSGVSIYYSSQYSNLELNTFPKISTLPRFFSALKMFGVTRKFSSLVTIGSRISSLRSPMLPLALVKENDSRTVFSTTAGTKKSSDTPLPLLTALGSRTVEQILSSPSLDNAGRKVFSTDLVHPSIYIVGQSNIEQFNNGLEESFKTSSVMDNLERLKSDQLHPNEKTYKLFIKKCIEDEITYGTALFKNYEVGRKPIDDKFMKRIDLAMDLDRVKKEFQNDQAAEFSDLPNYCSSGGVIGFFRNFLEDLRKLGIYTYLYGKGGLDILISCCHSPRETTHLTSFIMTEFYDRKSKV